MKVQDRRRILGPSNAKPIEFGADRAAASKAVKSSDEPEQLVLRTGVIENCNGSSLVEVNGGGRQVSLLSSVYGPRALRGSFTAMAAISIQLQNGSQEKYDSSLLREAASFLSNIFEAVVNRSRYPKSGIDIFVYLTYDLEQASRTNIAAIIPHCITAVTLALADAGIEIVDLAGGGFHGGNVFSFIKNGEEITGFWKDEGVGDDVAGSLEECKRSYLRYKGLMVDCLMQKQVMKE
ncbi:hypothetical protein HG536_0G01910 [Torulaspora globosa]|uniref:Exoribonuclease phosphorolytic domain-containing protein n=1 Tax=Torulaspora globosa TaxID=48254 RepID=A0A7G3ZLE6_9SACH|nr:uncharacterized protein HG536_0G01910 [Torulaspora globosa]QLL34332.1 hypothetical protein HG536_0G01910 [Torulaspora globosa]